LFGSKIKNKNKRLGVDERTDPKGFNAEMYWTMEQSKEKGKLSKSKKKVPFKSEIKDEYNDNIAEDKRLKKAKSKKGKHETVGKLPEALTRYKFDLPNPIKVTIRDVLDDLDSRMNSDTNRVISNQNEIPFNKNQLRYMNNFPLFVQRGDLITDIFHEAPLNNSIKVPSVSRILQTTMPQSQRNALIQWKNLKIAELGLEGFEEMQKSHMDRGKKFHECVQKYFSGISINEDEIQTDVFNIWKSVKRRLPEFDAPAQLTEGNIMHPFLYYKGIVDCVSLHDSTLSVIEWKKSDKLKKSISNTFDAPLQLCAYVGALNATLFKRTPIKKGVVVVAYNDGALAELFTLNEIELSKYWKLWLNRLQDYWIRYRDNTLNSDDI
jgi:genome maintenance exonuclease 1